MLCCPNSVVLSLLPPRTNPRLMNQSSAVRQKSQSWDPNLLALTWLTWVEAQLFFLTIQLPVSSLNNQNFCSIKTKFIGCCGAAAAFSTTELDLLINTAVHHTLQPIFAIFRYSSICDSTHRCWYVGLNQMLIFFKTVEPRSNGSAFNSVTQCWTCLSNTLCNNFCLSSNGCIVRIL